MKNQRESEIVMDLIARYLDGKISEDDFTKLEEWIKNSEINKKDFGQLRNIWEISNKYIDIGKINTEVVHRKILERISSNKFSKRPLWFYWQRIAAVILIPVLISSFILFRLQHSRITSSIEPSYNEINACFGTHSIFHLSDGSIVWLNSGSSLKYPIKFTKDKRVVSLNGEAYFEVQSNPSEPFIVESSALVVKATGTKFNVSSFNSSDRAEVTLVSGKLVIETSDTNRKEKNTYNLGNNQHFTYNKVTKSNTIVEEDPYKYIAWKDGKIIFRNEHLSQVVDKLSKIFNVDIELRGNDLQNYTYRATFQDESLGEILRLLKISSPIDYIEIKRDSFPDGSFDRKKIIIFSINSK